MNAISELLVEVEAMGSLSPETYKKMMHPVPHAEVINREKYILQRTRNKIVLDIGCVGPLSEAIRRIAKEYHGIDVDENPGVTHYHRIDLDKAKSLPKIEGLQIIVAGEIIEHLSNAGHFLDLIRAYNVPVILTTPNAHGTVSGSWLRRGIEHVNRDHVAWYSWRTLKTLVERSGFTVTDWHWYKGDPLYAEGLLFLLG